MKKMNQQEVYETSIGSNVKGRVEEHFENRQTVLMEKYNNGSDRSLHHQDCLVVCKFSLTFLLVMTIKNIGQQIISATVKCGKWAIIKFSFKLKLFYCSFF